MELQLPRKSDLIESLQEIKTEIEDDMIDEASLEEAKMYGVQPQPYIQVTLACDERGYALQTGDNSYSGGAYFYRHWGVGNLYRDSDVVELADDLINQCEDLFESAN